jgi:triosephosphate isomerase
MSIFGEEKFIVANFKQGGSKETFYNWLKDFKLGLKDLGELKINIVLCPSFPFLDLFKTELSEVSGFQKRIFIGSQNLSAFENLENTGEVSAETLKEFANFSIVGHSERKENFDQVTRKYEQALKNGIVPIVCFYENKSVYSFENCLFAYEDPKAISKEGVFQEKNFNEMIGIIEDLKEMFDSKPVLYGGSVKPDNAQMVKDLNFFKGVLVGRSSLNPESFLQIVKIYNN